jgi:hypothetical protein
LSTHCGTNIIVNIGETDTSISHPLTEDIAGETVVSLQGKASIYAKEMDWRMGVHLSSE